MPQRPTSLDRPKGRPLTPGELELVEFSAHLAVVKPGKGRFVAETRREARCFRAAVARITLARARGTLTRCEYGPARPTAKARRPPSTPRPRAAQRQARPRARRAAASSSTSSADPPPRPPRTAAHGVALVWLHGGARLIDAEQVLA
jgi:hypothetical protein